MQVNLRTATKSLFRGPHVASNPFLSLSAPSAAVPLPGLCTAPFLPKSLSDFPAGPYRPLSAPILSPAGYQHVPSWAPSEDLDSRLPLSIIISP